MKKRRLIILALMIVSVVVVFFVRNARPDPVPVLVFKGYDAGTNAVQYAKFELHNITSNTIWLCFDGPEFPLAAPFLKRQIAVASKETNTQATNNYIIRIGSYFMTGKKISRGQKLSFNFPLTFGKPAEQVGITYYFGNFKDGNDFLSNLSTPILNSSMTWKERIDFYWEKLKKSFKTPQPHEVWCSQPVAFQAGN